MEKQIKQIQKLVTARNGKCTTTRDHRKNEFAVGIKLPGELIVWGVDRIETTAYNKAFNLLPPLSKKQS